MPIVSIIMPSFNSEKYIEEAIKSVLNQSFISFELVIIDGGSTDKTVNIIQKFTKIDNRIIYINNIDDQGPAHARCVGIKKSKGTYIAFLDADDLWLSDKLNRQIGYMKTNGVSFCYTKYRLINESGGRVSCLIPMYSSYSFSQALARRGIGTLTVIMEKTLLTNDVISCYGKSHGEEYLWWLLILKKGVVARLLNIDSARYRKTGFSLSSHRYRYRHQKTVWHTYRNEIGLNLFLTTFNYTSYILDAAIRKVWTALYSRLSKNTV